MSPAISSSRAVAGMPAVQTPALVEGIYQTTVRVPASAKPGVYPVILRFGNRQVASINGLRVIGAGARTGRVARATGCDGISFTRPEQRPCRQRLHAGRAVLDLEPQHGLRQRIG